MAALQVGPGIRPGIDVVTVAIMPLLWPALGTVELESLQQKIYCMASTVEYGFFSPSAFLIDEMIKEIISIYLSKEIGSLMTN